MKDLTIQDIRKVAQGRYMRKHVEEGVCGFCGKSFKSFDLERRRNQSKCGKIFCSVQCGNQHKKIEREIRLRVKLGEQNVGLL